MPNFKLNFVTSALLLSVLGLTTFGCSGGGRGFAKIDVCKENYNPLRLDDTKHFGQKLEAKPGEPLAAAAGDYAYMGTQIYYYDKVRDIKLHIMHKKNSVGGFSIVAGCAGGDGLKPRMQPVHFEIPVVTDIFIDEQKNTLIRTRIITIDGRKRTGKAWLQLSISPEPETPTYQPGAPQDIYATDYSKITQFLFTFKKSKDLRFAFVAHLEKSISDNKTGKDGWLEVRASVNYKKITPEERKKLDDNHNKSIEE